MTIAEQLIEEGRQIGWEEGRQIGREEGRREGPDRHPSQAARPQVQAADAGPRVRGARLQAATSTALDRYEERVLFADSVAAVFAD